VVVLMLPVTSVMADQPIQTDGLPATPVVAGGNWYIVQFKALPLALHAKEEARGAQTMYVGGKLNVDAPASQAYLAQLKEQQKQFGLVLAKEIPDAQVHRGYQIALNAVAVQLPDSELETLKILWSLPEVARVTPQVIYSVDMDYSLPLIDADVLWTQLGGRDAAGAGIKVAIIDSGIEPDHPMFDGTGWSYPATGSWPKGEAAFTNGKIIAARYYPPTFEVNVDEELSPQDHHGHGSHTAGTAAGNRVVADYGTSSVEISGVAPGAWIMAYKGLFLTPAGTGASGSNIMLAGAVEDAIADGADVINNSWGGTAITLPKDDPLSCAYEAAVDAGISVVFSAGNAGPGYDSVGNPSSPKFIEVGGSTTERAYYNEIRVTAPEPVAPALQSFPGNEFHDIVASAIPSEPIGPLPYLPTDLLGNPDLTLPGVYPGITETEPYSSTGWIALIPRGTYNFTLKLDNALAHGADAAVMYTDDRTWKGGFTAGDRPIYTVMIANDLGLEARSWWETYTDTARIEIGYPAVPFESEIPDMIAEFSSRGPHVDLAIKPDVVAPGVNVLSAGLEGDYYLWGGTSMSAPHVSGAAVLLRQMHPDWTPAQVKSALMATAYQEVVDLDGVTVADVMTQGAGRIDLGAAADPGLTFDLPSHSFGMVPQGSSAQVMITAKDVSGMAESYNLDVVETVDDAGKVTVSVSPVTLDMAVGGTGTFTVTVNVKPSATVQDLEGNIVLSGTTHLLHIPYWLRVYEDSGAEVLLVDLDESGATGDYGSTNIYGMPFIDCTNYYTTTLEALGITYDYWDVWSTPPYSPPRAVLDAYDKVIVYTGNYGGLGYIGTGLYLLDSLEPNDFRNYLAGGGKMLVMGQDAVGDQLVVANALGVVDGLAPYMRGADASPLLDSIFGYTEPPTPSVVGLDEANPFLKDVVVDLGFGGDGAANQLLVDEVNWINYIDLDTQPLFEAVNTVPSVESGYVGTRSSFEPTIERVQNPVAVPQEPVSWRVGYTAFGLEGVNDDTGYSTRSELIDLLFNWLDDEVTVAFDQDSYFVSRGFDLADFSATLTSSLGGDAVYYRWDFGDGSGIEVTSGPATSHQYQQCGFYTAWVEAMDVYGHKAVGEPVTVEVCHHYYLPLMFKTD
ncbi:MAG: S8 family serine peptidase, partial [Anaerolineae bacterium]